MKCRHCGVPIRRVKYARLPVWIHEDDWYGCKEGQGMTEAEAFLHADPLFQEMLENDM